MPLSATCRSVLVATPTTVSPTYRTNQEKLQRKITGLVCMITDGSSRNSPAPHYVPSEEAADDLIGIVRTYLKCDYTIGSASNSPLLVLYISILGKQRHVVALVGGACPGPIDRLHPD